MSLRITGTGGRTATIMVKGTTNIRWQMLPEGLTRSSEHDTFVEALRAAVELTLGTEFTAEHMPERSKPTFSTHDAYTDIPMTPFVPIEPPTPSTPRWTDKHEG